MKVSHQKASPPLARYALALCFSVAGLLHFIFPAAYAGIMPPWLPAPLLLVYVSGACELAGALGLLPVRTRHLAGIGLIALSLAVLPANVQMLLNARAAGDPAWQQGLLLLRLPLQAALIWWIWRVSRQSCR
ncbi:DoxX family protein [Janthinobacterium sp. HLX7-2]|uniref:DoxX family protein n=1 Tax=Janthinobacterium sp. HLX7-2 TaxID=1259331 RepID=UPI003F243144